MTNIVHIVEKEGGITLDRNMTVASPDRGYLVTVGSRIFDNPRSALAKVRGFKTDMHHTFGGAISKRVYFGIYKFTDGEHYSADINLHFDEKDVQSAFELGEMLNQEAIWDCRHQSCVMTGGDGTGTGLSLDLIRIIASGLGA